MMIPRVFISYASADMKWVNRFAKDLAHLGVETWLDRKDILPGDEIVTRIEQGIATCNIFCLVLSSSSVKRPWVRREYVTAMHAQLSGGSIRIIPLKIEDCELPPFLLDIKYADFITNYRDGLEAFCRGIGVNINRPIPYSKTFDILRSASLRLEQLMEMFKTKSAELYDHKMYDFLFELERSIVESIKITFSEIRDYPRGVTQVKQYFNSLSNQDFAQEPIPIFITSEVDLEVSCGYDNIMDYCFPYYIRLEGLYELLQAVVKHWQQIFSRKMHVLPKRFSSSHDSFPDGWFAEDINVIRKLSKLTQQSSK